MICLNIYRHSLQNIQRLTAALWASHQSIGRTSRYGAPDDENRDCRKRKKNHRPIIFALLEFILLIYENGYCIKCIHSVFYGCNSELKISVEWDNPSALSARIYWEYANTPCKPIDLQGVITFILSDLFLYWIELHEQHHQAGNDGREQREQHPNHVLHCGHIGIGDGHHGFAFGVGARNESHHAQQ